MLHAGIKSTSNSCEIVSNDLLSLPKTKVLSNDDELMLKATSAFNFVWSLPNQGRASSLYLSLFIFVFLVFLSFMDNEKIGEKDDELFQHNQNSSYYLNYRLPTC